MYKRYENNKPSWVPKGKNHQYMVGTLRDPDRNKKGFVSRNRLFAETLVGGSGASYLGARKLFQKRFEVGDKQKLRQLYDTKLAMKSNPKTQKNFATWERFLEDSLKNVENKAIYKDSKLFIDRSIKRKKAIAGMALGASLLSAALRMRNNRKNKKQNNTNEVKT